MVVCLDMSIDQDVDIIFSEYILNDGRADGIENDRVKEYERLVRRVLALPNRPPMIMMQVNDDDAVSNRHAGFPCSVPHIFNAGL